MSTHQNTKPHALKFDLGGKVYEVEPHGEVAIPDRFHAHVKRRGLPLVTHAEAEAMGKPKPVAPDAAAVAEMSAKLTYAQRHAHEVDAKLAEVEAATRDFTDAIRARLGIGADDKILDALDVLLAPKGDAVPDAPKAEKPAKK